MGHPDSAIPNREKPPCTADALFVRRDGEERAPPARETSRDGADSQSTRLGYPKTSLTLLGRLKSSPAEHEQAWQRFVDLYCPLVYRLAKKKGLDRETSENLFQDFCCQMVKRMPTFEYDPSIGRFRDWLLTVALNLIRRHWRDKAARQRRLDEYRERERRGEFDEQPNAKWWESAEWTRQLQLALDMLYAEVTPRDRDLFQRIVLEGQAVTDVVAKHGISANTWYGIKYRILGRLRGFAQEIRRDWE
jgi:RNA polymerase sigma-70 factor (ECF subfamily)